LRTRLAWHNFCTDDLDYLEHLAQNGAEPIGSLGYDGPLAVLHPERQSLADYCKESVAVATNPALDRDRETEHFNTQTLLGARPATPYPTDDAPLSGAAAPVFAEPTPAEPHHTPRSH
jgi:hypothetical protein